MALIGLLSISTQVDNSKLGKGLKETQSKVQGFTANLTNLTKTVGGLAAGFVALRVVQEAWAATMHGVELLDEFGDLAAKFGDTAQNIAAMHYAAEQFDVSTEAMDAGLGKLNVRLGELQMGSKGAVEAFAALGLSASDLAGKSVTEAFKEVSDKIKAIKDPALQAALAVKVFGKSGTELLGILKAGSEAIEEQRKRMEELGFVITEEMVDANEEVTQVFKDLKTVWDAITTQLADALGPAIKEVGELLVYLGTDIIQPMMPLIKMWAEQFAVSVKMVTTAFMILAQTVQATIGVIAGTIGWLVGNDELEKWGDNLVSESIKTGERIKELWDETKEHVSKPIQWEKTGRMLGLGVYIDVGREIRNHYVQALEEARKKVEELQKAIQDSEKDWSLQAHTFGMTARQARIYELALQGATDAQLANLRALDAWLTAAEEKQKAQEEAIRAEKEHQKELEQARKEAQEEQARKEQANLDRIAQLHEDALTDKEKFARRSKEIGDALRAGEINELQAKELWRKNREAFGEQKQPQGMANFGEAALIGTESGRNAFLSTLMTGMQQDPLIDIEKAALGFHRSIDGNIKKLANQKKSDFPL